MSARTRERTCGLKSWDNKDMVKEGPHVTRKWAILQLPRNIMVLVLYCLIVYTETWIILKQSN